MSTLVVRNKKSNVLTDPSSIALSSSDGTYGVKRNDTGAVVVADGTAMTQSATGVYTYTFTDPADDLTYTYATEIVQEAGEAASFFTFQFTGPVATITTSDQWTNTTLAAQIRGEIDADPDAAGGTVPARLSSIVIQAGIKLWEGWDWYWRTKEGTLSVADEANTADLPYDFAKMDSRWLESDADSRSCTLEFTQDAIRWREYANRFENDGTDDGEPRLALIDRDTTRTPWGWRCRTVPRADQAYEYLFMYLTNNPWTGSTSASSSEQVADTTVPSWPQAFNEGWYRRARWDAFSAFGSLEQAAERKKEWKDWLGEARAENDEVLTNPYDRSNQDAYNDFGRIASSAQRSGWLGGLSG